MWSVQVSVFKLAILTCLQNITSAIVNKIIVTVTLGCHDSTLVWILSAGTGVLSECTRWLQLTTAYIQIFDSN